MDAAYILDGADPLPATRAPYVRWQGQPRPAPTACADCAPLLAAAYAEADAAETREAAARRFAEDTEAELAQALRTVAQLTRAIEGGTA